MVSLVKLSSHNIETFRELSSNNLNNESYDKDFFEYYKKSGFIPKVFMKKFVKLFLYNGEFIGYIWHEVPMDLHVKVLSLYVDKSYTEVINKNTLRAFDNNLLVYESMDNYERKSILTNLGFTRVNSSILMCLKLSNYNKEHEIQNVYDNIYRSNIYSSNLSLQNYQKLIGTYITFEQIQTKSDIFTRCDIQNKIFHESNRIPMQIEDIENDISQDYYINDLAYFIKLNGTSIGYGQVIYTRNMYTIVNFGITEEYRGQGFGKLLLNYLIKKANINKIEELFLRVEESNINAIKLYKWMGFERKNNINKWERK